jgi:integrase
MASIRKKVGSGYWYACFYLPDGQRTQRSTKTNKRDKALRIAIEWEEAARNKLTEAQIRRVLSEIHEKVHGRPLVSATLAGYRDQWLKRKEGETESSTHAAYKGSLDSFIQFMGARESDPIHFVQTADIVAWRDSETKGKSARTANNKLKALRVFFGSAWRDGLVHENPAAKVAALKTEESARRPFTLDELKKILAIADSEWRVMILTGLYTGQRLRDIALLTWANVDMVRDEIALTTSKTKRRQIIPIAAPLKLGLADLPAQDEPTAPLFPKAYDIATRTDTSRLSQMFHDLLVNAGMATKRPPKHKPEGHGRAAARRQSDITFHSLRHTATSLLKNAGVSEAVAMDIIGHDSEAISRHYTHVDSATKRAAMNKMPDINEL